MNELTKRRIHAFKQRKTALWSLYIISILLIIGICSNFVANNKPYIMKFNGHLYFPVLKTYHPKIFGINDTFVMDYKVFQSMHPGDTWMLFPPIRWSPYESNRDLPEFPSPPSKINLLGTDDRGRDVLTRLIYGFRVSMLYALSVWILAYLLGIFIGSLMGFVGGWIDFTAQRAIEVISSIPYFFLLIILIAIFEPSLWLLVILSSILEWIGISYYIRAEFLRIRRFEFVESCRALGMKRRRIVFRHILPNALSPIYTFSPFFIAGGIFGLAGLDYLGFGVPPPTPSWGELLNQGKSLFNTAWWLALFPSMALFSVLTL